MKPWFLIFICPCLCLGLVPAKKLWLLLFISFSISSAVAIKLLLDSPNKNKKRNLPPGPPTIPFLGNLQLLKKTVLDIESFLRQLHAKYGPIITLMSRITTSNQHTISSAGYGSSWRNLRRNLVSGVFHRSCFKSYSQGRKWVLKTLVGELTQHADSGEPVVVFEKVQYAMFSLLSQKCFGQKLDQSTVKKIEDIQRRMITGFDISTLFPWIGKILRFLRSREKVDITGSREIKMMPFGVGRHICRALNLASAYRTPFPYFFLFLIFSLSLNPLIIEATRPWAGAASPPLRENTTLQPLEKAPVEGNHSSCSYTPAIGGRCPTPTVHGTSTAGLP